MRTKHKRFSVSLSVPEYKKLQRIAAAHRPLLSMQYIVHWALQGVLDREWIVRKPPFTLAMMTVLGTHPLIFFVARAATPAFTGAGPANLFSAPWNPQRGQYRMLIFLPATLAPTLAGPLLGPPLPLTDDSVFSAVA